MQLGELQNQLQRFTDRQISLLALSVDPAQESAAMVDRLGLDFVVASDQNQRVIQQFRVQNPTTRELALHAVYILDGDGRIYYRKVGLRRPISNELIDAIDAHRGTYPRNDEAIAPRQRIKVAFPQNNFQALLALSADVVLAKTIDIPALEEVMEVIRNGGSDDAVFAFRHMIKVSPDAPQQDLINAAIWMTRQLTLRDNADALSAGRQLRQRLERLEELEGAMAGSSTTAPTASDDLLVENLSKARAGLSVLRREIERNALAWRLRSAKTTLRVYRELARAGRS